MAALGAAMATPAAAGAQTSPLGSDPVGPISNVTADWQYYQPASDFCVPDQVVEIPSDTQDTQTGSNPACAFSGFTPADSRTVRGEDRYSAAVRDVRAPVHRLRRDQAELARYLLAGTRVLPAIVGQPDLLIIADGSQSEHQELHQRLPGVSPGLGSVTGVLERGPTLAHLRSRHRPFRPHDCAGAVLHRTVVPEPVRRPDRRRVHRRRPGASHPARASRARRHLLRSGVQHRSGAVSRHACQPGLQRRQLLLRGLHQRVRDQLRGRSTHGRAADHGTARP